MTYASGEEAITRPEYSWRAIARYAPGGLVHVAGSPTFYKIEHDIHGKYDMPQHTCRNCGIPWTTQRYSMAVHSLEITPDYSGYSTTEKGCRACMNDLYLDPYLGMFLEWTVGISYVINRNDSLRSNYPVRKELSTYFAALDKYGKAPNAYVTMVSYPMVRHVLYELLGEEVDLNSKKTFNEYSCSMIADKINFANIEETDLDELKSLLGALNILKKKE
jgi:hypothetical protein